MTTLEVVPIEGPLVMYAVDTSRATTISLWNALVVEAARQAKCQRLSTEDLSHGQVIRGVTGENPFKPAKG